MHIIDQSITSICNMTHENGANHEIHHGNIYSSLLIWNTDS